MKYVRGLDGLRAVAVIVVVLFHAQAPFTGGGFLGVSLFFTLSGFLITTLLLGEHDQSGVISMRHFYGRRARRLLPAAYACLALVLAWSVWWTTSQRRSLGGDVVAAVANVANWRFAFASTSYQDIFLSAPSPIAHFWSLAIEEQIYLLLPIVVVLTLRRSRRALAITTAVLLGASLASTLLTSNRNIVYYGTHTRAAELLVGVALAQWMFRVGGRNRSVEIVRHRADWVPGAVALLLFGGLVTMGSLDQEWLYRGGLLGVALVSALLIHAVISDRFPARVLEVAPLVAIGKVSYGVYLFHWPVFLLLDGTRTGLDGVALFVVRIAVTAVLTIASYRLLERPIRTGRVGGRNIVALPAFGLAAVIIVAVALVLGRPALTPTEELLSMGDQAVVEFTLPPTSVVAATSTTLPPTPSVLVIGSDRSAIDAIGASGLTVIDGVRPECPLSSVDVDGCEPLDSWFRKLADREEPAAVVIAVGPAEDADAAAQLAIVGPEWKASEQDVVAVLDEATALGVPVVFFYPSPDSAPFSSHLERFALMRPWVGAVTHSAPELIGALNTALAGTSTAPSQSDGAQALRVMVIGDSTSINMAKALSDAGDGRLSVLWAGANGCPLVAVEVSRTASDAEWSDPGCDSYAEKLPPLLERFDPDVVLLVLGPTELAEQRYAGDPDGHIAGDPSFAAARDVAMQELLDVLDPSVPLLIADAPRVDAGVFVTREMADPGRLAAVNAQVAAWDERWSQVARFDYRGPLEAAEAADGSMRSDGVHPDADRLEQLARSVYVDQLIAQTAEVRAAP